MTNQNAFMFKKFGPAQTSRPDGDRSCPAHCHFGFAFKLSGRAFACLLPRRSLTGPWKHAFHVLCIFFRVYTEKTLYNSPPFPPQQKAGDEREAHKPLGVREKPSPSCQSYRIRIIGYISPVLPGQAPPLETVCQGIRRGLRRPMAHKPPWAG